MRKAVLDVGSNSVLLTVEDRTPQGWRPVLEKTRVTSLGEGVKQSGFLSEPAMQRTLEAMGQLWRIAEAAGAWEIVAAATMAARMARNAPDFQARAAAQGTPVSILSGDEEAALGFQSVVSDPLFRGARRISIVDVGGQSTEIVTAEASDVGWKTMLRRSYPIGTLALRNGLLSEQTPAIADLLRAVQEVDDQIGLVYLPQSCGEVVTLGATGTNLVSIREKMTEWDPAVVHGAHLDYEEVSKAVGWMFRMSDSERAAIPGMERGREKTLHIGALILERCMNALRCPACRVSVRGWRHALLERSVPSI